MSFTSFLHFRQLTNSLLKEIDPKKATADELREAFCRFSNAGKGKDEDK